VQRASIMEPDPMIAVSVYQSGPFGISARPPITLGGSEQQALHRGGLCTYLVSFRAQRVWRMLMGPDLVHRRLHR